MVTKIDRKPARIHFEDGQVVVHPADQDIFMVTAEKAIEACLDAIRRDERLHHFKETLLKPLSDWAKAHAQQVQALYLAQTNSAHITAYAIGTSERYDFELAGELAALDLIMGDRGWRISIHLIPKMEDDEDLCNFFDPKRALQIYG